MRQSEESLEGNMVYIGQIGWERQGLEKICLEGWKEVSDKGIKNSVEQCRLGEGFKEEQDDGRGQEKYVMGKGINKATETNQFLGYV